MVLLTGVRPESELLISRGCVAGRIEAWTDADYDRDENDDDIQIYRR